MRLILFIFLFFGGFSVNAQINPKLLAAIQANDLAAVKTINPAPAMLNAQDKNGASALMWAAYKGDLAMVQYLVEQGADHQLQGAICLDDTCGGYYGNLTGIAAGEGKLNMLRYFIEDLKIPVDDVEWNPVTREKDGWTGLTWACSKNTTEAAIYLLEKSANPKANLWIPLEQSISNKNDTISSLLTPFYEISDGISPDLIYNAAKAGMDSVVYSLLKIRISQDDYTAALCYYALGDAFKEESKLENAYEAYGIFYTELEKKNVVAKFEYFAGKAMKNMANIKFRLHKYAVADSLSQIWLEHSIHEVGDSSEEYGSRLREYADSLMEHGMYKQAEKPFQKIAEIWKKRESCGRCHAIAINNIGWNLLRQTRYNDAIPYLVESLSLWKKLENRDDKEIQVTLWNLGETFVGLEKYDEAETTWLERLTITKSIWGESSKETSVALNDLGWMYRQKKDFTKAEAYLKMSLKIGTELKNFDPESYRVSIENLALVYTNQNLSQKALQIKLVLLDTLSKHKGFEQRIIDLYGDVADLYKELKNYDSAITSFKQQIEMEERLNGKTKWKYWNIYDEIADAFYKKRDFQNALIWWQKYDQSNFSETKVRLVKVNLSLKNFDEANKYYKIILSEIQVDYLKYYKNSSKNYKYKVAGWNQSSYHIGYSIAYLHPLGKSCENGFDVALASKNKILNESKQISHFVILSDNKYFQDSLRRLSVVQNAYANLFHFQSKEDANKRKEALLSEIESLQSFLSKAYYESQPDLKNSYDAHWQDIQSALRPNEAAIEFVDFRLHLTDWTDTTLYAALVLRPEWEAPRFITLFEAKTIAALLDDKQERGAAYAEKLYPNDGRATPVGNKNISLHQLIWAKLDSLLQGVQTLYYSPSGYLNRLNLGAIANPNKQTAAERYHLVQMASTRQLLQKRLETKPNRTAALFGGLQYSADSISMARSIEKFRDKKTGNTTRSFLDLTGESPAPFDTLSFTRAEVHGIKPILKKSKYKYTTLTDFDGTEEALYALCAAGKSPGILHFSTHGFFFSPPSDDSLSARTNLPFALAGNSMLRSGIVLSGCNRFWTTGKTFPGLHDGILTAYEAAQLDLTNTELVVLSACETALGDLNVEGGVFGLQRAFIQAGAHYVMMSLWKVDDSTTQEFMTTFYEKWLQDKKSIPDAFQETQIAIRKAHPNPYFWAPFIIVE